MSSLQPDVTLSLAAPRLNLAAERYLRQLGLRSARVRVEANVGHIQADPRDLWRIVARRDELLARLGELGLEHVELDLDAPPVMTPDPPAFS